MDGKWTRGEGGSKKAENGWTSFVQAPLFGTYFSILPFGIFIKAIYQFKNLQLVKYLSVCDERIHYLALKGFKVAIHNYHQSRLGKEFFPSCSSDEDLETHGVELQQQMKKSFT